MSTKATTLSPAIKGLIVKEFTSFFTTMCTPNDKGWPAVPHNVFVDALADSLLEMGKQNDIGIALLQTLVHELQDRINTATN